jgi:cytochrome P450
MKFDTYDISFQVNPYPVYAALRREGSLHYVDEYEFWVATRWDDVHELAHSPALTAKFGSQRDPIDKDAPELPPYANSIIMFDPPEHTKFRRSLQKLFSPRAIRSWPFRVESIASRLVSDLVEAGRDGQVDFAARLAARMPMLVFVELMGIPASDLESLTQTYSDITGSIAGNVDDECVARSLRAGNNLLMYCKDLLDSRRGKEPRENIVDNLLIAQREDPDPMSEDELLSNTVFLMLAGIDTTDSLLTNGVTALLKHPEQIMQLRSDPAAIAGAVEEMLRYDGPAQGNFRTVASDLTIGGIKLHAGDRILLCWSAANRDESLFPEADGEQFNISRHQPGHMGFGSGVHVCLGSQLARLEVRAVLAELVLQTQHIELINEPTVEVFRMPIMRGHRDIQISVG